MRKFAVTLCALLSLLAWTPAFASTTISGTLSGNNTWTKVESPYVVNGTLILPADSSLTIEPGTVIKMDGVFFVFIEGTLSALGTAADPITITSMKDDTAGGDTNGDEGASQHPLPGIGSRYTSLMVLREHSHTPISATEDEQMDGSLQDRSKIKEGISPSHTVNFPTPPDITLTGTPNLARQSLHNYQVN